MVVIDGRSFFATAEQVVDVLWRGGSRRTPAEGP